MREYLLSASAENDLDEIAAYTLDRWGPDQMLRYGAALEAHFRALVSGALKPLRVFDTWPELQVSRCQHHHVFSLQRSCAPLVVLAVFHESMDLPARLRERLDVVEEEFLN